MFTQGVKINYITVWSNPNSALLRLVMFPILPHRSSPAGSGQAAGCEHAGCISQVESSVDTPRHWSTYQCSKVSFSLPTNLESSELLKKTSSFKSRAASEACYSRGREGGSWHIKRIHEQNIIESIHPLHKTPSLLFLRCIGGYVACPSSQPVCGQKGKCLSTGASDRHCWRNKAMLHLSTLCQQSPWHAHHQNRRVTWSVLSPPIS